MRYIGILVVALLLGVASPVSAAPPQLIASDGIIGGITIGSCNLETFNGCLVKTVTITNPGAKTRIAGIGVQSSLNDISLANDTQTTDCNRLPLNGNGYWVLGTGRSCTVRVAVAPACVGDLTRTLTLWNPKHKSLVTVPIIARGTLGEGGLEDPC